MPDGSTVTRPEHSPLGGSSAERWMACPGSVALARAIGPEKEDPDYRVEGTTAHALAAHCLEKGIDGWEAMDVFPTADMEMASAVQAYLDYVRSRMGEKTKLAVEQDLENIGFHPLAYGRLDAALLGPEGPKTDPLCGMVGGVDGGLVLPALEIIDYKHGVGVQVDVEGNTQERYYAFNFLHGDRWPWERSNIGPDDLVRLTIVQPRGFHPDGPIRSTVMRVKDIVDWAYDELRPAMERAGEKTFSMGEHCRFCPAKLICPAMRHLATDAALVAKEVTGDDDFKISEQTDEWLGFWYGKLPLLDMFKKAIQAEAAARALRGVESPSWKLVYGMVDRVWKEGAPDDMERMFGADAWEPRKLRSPAQVEKLPGGKEFCAEYATKPPGSLTIASITDKRAAQKAQTNEDVFAGVEIPA